MRVFVVARFTIINSPIDNTADLQILKFFYGDFTHDTTETQLSKSKKVPGTVIESYFKSFPLNIVYFYTMDFISIKPA